MLFTYQKRISFGLCLLFIYYYSFSLFESYEIGQSRFHHPKLSINYIPLYITSIHKNSQQILPTITPLINYPFISLFISLYLLCEILFYFRWRYLENYINTNIKITDTNPTITNQRRDHILKMGAKYATLHKNGISNWLSLWFKGQPFQNIYYDNIIEYLDWAFWLKYYPKNIKNKCKEIKWRNDFKDFAVNCIESMTNHQFIKGYNSNMSFVHNTDNNIPISTTYRPFLFYLCLFVAQFITDLIFIYILNFQYKYINNLKVWYKIQSNSNSKLKTNPILLVHGLGVHYMPYIPLIYKLLNKSKSNDIFCIEIPWIAMSLKNFIPKSIWKMFSNNPSPSYINSQKPANKKDFVEILMNLEDILIREYNTIPKYERHKNNPLQLEWNLIGHSYGTFIVAGVYNYIKHNSRCDKNINLPRLILLDPVTLMLSQPITVRFLCLKAVDWPSYFMQQLAAKELMIACSLNKYFHWFEYNLYPEDLINNKVKHVVITGTNDRLIPCQLIKKGINDVNEKWKEKGYKRIQHVEFENMHHAIWLGLMSCVQKIVDVV